MSEQTTQFVARYWIDILLLVSLAVIACVFIIIHLIDRARKKRAAGNQRVGHTDFEKPPFEVEYAPDGDCK